jgi:hypothetical protein
MAPRVVETLNDLAEKMDMKYITIDGDDVGQKITSSYLRNDLSSLMRINELIKNKTNSIADFLREQGFSIIFCAADGVAAYHDGDNFDEDFIYSAIRDIAGQEISFSAGVGRDLRESYISLLFAKSSGKARLHNFETKQSDV